VKNRKNDRSDASPHVDHKKCIHNHLGDVHGPGLDPVLPSGRLSCLAPSPSGVVSEGGIVSWLLYNLPGGLMEAFWSCIAAP